MAVEQGRNDYKVAAVIAKAMADLKSYQAKAEVERGIAIDVNTGEILYDATGDATHLDVSGGFGDDRMPLGIAGKARFMAAQHRSVLDIHTHVAGQSMSARDWGAFMLPQIVECRLITDDAVYVLRKTDAFARLPEMVVTPQAVKAKYNYLYDKWVAKTGGDKTQTSVAATIETSKEMARELVCVLEVMQR